MKYLLFYFVIQGLFGATIILDPGHGGEDLGAKTTFWHNHKKEKKLKVYFEKDVVMSFGKKLEAELKKRGHQVFMTRTFDRTVALENRSKMADKVNADIFISIHANASSSKRSRGVETFYLDNHTDKAVRRIEKLENISSKGKEAIVDKIIIDLAVQKTAPLSKKLAHSIHKKLEKGVIKKNKLRNRGIKPGLFYVLALSMRPAVLLEVGFLTNQKEGKLIMSDKFQKQYAHDVADGIDAYVKSGTKTDKTMF